MFKLLVDTCVWLDIAKDQQQQATLGVLEELIRLGQVDLLVPHIVRDEFARNKARIAQESRRSLSGVLKRARQVVEQLGDAKQKRRSSSSGEPSMQYPRAVVWAETGMIRSLL